MDNSPCLYSNALDSTRTCDLHMVSNFSEKTFTLPASWLQPRRTDLDMNQHVNNVKYINWMMEVC